MVQRVGSSIDLPGERTLKTWVLALTSIASFRVILDALVVATALTRIRLSLGASLEALQWTVNAYNLSFAAELVQQAAFVTAGREPLARTKGCGVFADTVRTHVASWLSVTGILRQRFAVR